MISTNNLEQIVGEIRKVMDLVSEPQNRLIRDKILDAISKGYNKVIGNKENPVFTLEKEGMPPLPLNTNIYFDFVNYLLDAGTDKTSIKSITIEVLLCDDLTNEEQNRIIHYLYCRENSEDVGELLVSHPRLAMLIESSAM